MAPLDADYPGGSVTEEPAWGYGGRIGPENWASLSERYRTCAEGKRQSPINIAGYVLGDTDSLSFSYVSGATSVRNDGNLVHVEFREGSALAVGRRVCRLESAHFHVPSEHRIDGRGFAAELHLVHTDRRGALVVVGQVFELGTASPGAQGIIDAAPRAGAEIVDGLALDAALFAPPGQSHFRYEGSKTTPPCEEPVGWYVMRRPRTISSPQVDRLLELSRGPNSRPLQPRGDRVIISAG